MSPKMIIFYMALAAVVLLLFIYWQTMNAKRAVSQRSDQKSRKTDRIQLRGQQKKIYRHAMTLAAQQNYKGSAQLLESLGLYRDAVQILEANGLPREAASVLMRLRRPNRAGVILERAQLWKEAAQCYTLANLPADVARCAREAGDLITAADNFLKAGKYEDAAECYAERGDHHGAAKIFLKLGKKTRAIELYQTLVESTDKCESIIFTDEELNVIADYLREGNTDPRLTDILVVKNRLASVIMDLVQIGNLKSAAELYLRSTTDIGPQLISVPHINDHDSATLAQLFLKVSRFEYAGVIFERLGDQLNAGHAFRNAEEFERAALCYERADKKDLAVEMRIQLAQHGGNKKSNKRLAELTGQAKVKNDNSSPFSIEAMGDSRPSGNSLPSALTMVPVSETGSSPELSSSDSSRSNMILSLDEEGEAKIEEERTALLPDASSVAKELAAASAAKNPSSSANKAMEVHQTSSTTVAADQGGFSLHLDEATKASAPAWSQPAHAAAEGSAVASAALVTKEKETLVTATVGPSSPFVPSAAANPSSPSRTSTPLSGDDTPSPTKPFVLESLSHPTSFRQAKFCEDLAPDQVEMIWELGQSIEYGAGETILDFNDEPKGVYFILSGEVSCHRRIEGREEEIDRMGSPSTIGEFWLLVDMPTQVKFIATNSCHVRIIPRDPFNALLDTHGSIARKLYKRFTQRLIRKLVTGDNNRENRQAS